MAAYGLRPVIEIQFADYIYPAYDQLVSEAARLRYRSAGDFTAPITVRIALWRRHLRRPNAQPKPRSALHPRRGLKTVIPSTPYDAKGLLISAIEDDDPVIFFEPKRIYNGPFDGLHDRPVTPWSKHPASEVPEGYYKIPLGKAASCAKATTSPCSPTARWCTSRSPPPKRAGIDAEVIDLRTLLPVDIETIVASVEKTGRCVIVHEATRTSGYGAELSALVQEHCFYQLEAPIERVTG